MAEDNELKDRRQGERRVAEPCIHERDWIRLEQTVERHDKELRDLHADGTGTKIYMKQVIDSQQEIKDSIRAIQEELKSRPAQAPTPVPVELVQSAPTPAPAESSSGWSATIQKITPTVVQLVLILVIIIAALVGADSIVTKAIGGTP